MNRFEKVPCHGYVSPRNRISLAITRQKIILCEFGRSIICILNFHPTRESGNRGKAHKKNKKRKRTREKVFHKNKDGIKLLGSDSKAIHKIDNCVSKNRKNYSDKRIYKGLFCLFHFFFISIGNKKLNSSPRDGKDSKETYVFDSFFNNSYNRIGSIFLSSRTRLLKWETHRRRNWKFSCKNICPEKSKKQKEKYESSDFFYAEISHDTNRIIE